MSMNEASFATERVQQAASAGEDATPSGARPRAKLAVSARAARRLRPNRLRVEDLRLEGMTAAAQHPTLGPLGGVVEDLSIHGLGIVVTALRDAPIVLPGDRLTRLTI